MDTKVQFQIVITTVGRRNEARRLARKMVDSRLAACVQVFPIRSVYRWKGKVEQASEYRLEAKTRSALVPRLMSLIRRCHSYELPEIVAVPIRGGLAGYLRWIREETRNQRLSAASRGREKPL